MWAGQISSDISKLPEFIDYYTNEYNSAKLDVKIKGSVERALSVLPGITEERFSQLQDIEAVLNILNLQLRKQRRECYRKYLENYDRALTSKEIERYTDGEDDIIAFETLINEVALLRNKYLGIIKGLESKGFSLNNLSRLKISGFDDFTL